ncbi:UNVERIFIED_CONTAM: Retrovirus-related Pol polyprotein from transposon TNT 1-94 [Sesamum radiatum]|uniref:Retrovirus-related Pol polyprotein from transposon TNT 1-94 n=1 Tax=Sesamum radiatum TaxID=300843 RepID=A0AAW2QIT5_SESRA
MPIFLVLYVDDMLIASPSLTLIAELQNNLGKSFEMKDLGNAKKIIGMSIERNGKNSTIFLNQSAYIRNVLAKFSMKDAKPAFVPLAAHFQLCKYYSPKTESEKEKMKNVPYSNAIGSVMYLMVLESGSQRLKGNDESFMFRSPWVWSKGEYVNYLWPKPTRPNPE